MSKAHPPELKKYMDKRLSLKLNGGNSWQQRYNVRSFGSNIIYAPRTLTVSLICIFFNKQSTSF
ncbi:uncharacterized protein LOC105837424 isoform X2 [Monomorium pharaonis]|uniref:uncharacterized protein LOC105837424 isoform X2 n=1 Tax=Monomorium pharaonis TaxID=307658 RepID=UPI001747CE45|nr:uncharacterized protein LOC105837424 isoform X2 [Monomorium pharaonis]